MSPNWSLRSVGHVVPCLLMNLAAVWAAIPVDVQSSSKVSMRSLEEIVSCSGQVLESKSLEGSYSVGLASDGAYSCAWLLVPPSSSVVSVEFSLGLNSSLECSKDFSIDILVCQDILCTTKTSFQKVCGSTTELVPLNFGLYINLSFLTNPSPAEINFTYTGRSQGCMNTNYPIRSNTGQISETIAAGANGCNWLVQPSGISRVLMSLRAFGLQQASCNNGSLRIHLCLDGECLTTALHQLSTCANISNGTITLDSQYGAKIEVDSLSMDAYGLEINWDSFYRDCNSSRTLITSDVISLTNGGSSWTYNYDCEWWFSPSNASHVTSLLQTFPLQGSAAQYGVQFWSCQSQYSLESIQVRKDCESVWNVSTSTLASSYNRTFAITSLVVSFESNGGFQGTVFELSLVSLSCTTDQYVEQGASICTKCTVCQDGEVVVSACSALHDSICRTCTPCHSDQYVASPCNQTADNVCRNCSICNLDQILLRECNGSSDRECGDCHNFSVTLDGLTCSCIEGFERTNTSNVCTPCKPNTYKDEINNSLCKPCPEFSICPQQSTNLSDCQCIAGYERKDGICIPCPLGFYKESVGNSQCESCPSN
eukprot:93310-Hanusia_phi.AAC.1